MRPGDRATRSGARAHRDGSSVAKEVLAGSAAFFAAILGWGVGETFELVEEWTDAEVPELPQEWQGRRIAVLCDLHLGQLANNTVTIRRAVDRIVEEAPDLILIPGDFIHGDPESVAQAVRILAPLPAAGTPCFAVLGNHDYAMPTGAGEADERLADNLTSQLERAGIRVLHNEAVALGAPDGELLPARAGGSAEARPEARPGRAPHGDQDDGRQLLHLVGIAAHTPGYDRPRQALAQVPAGASRIVMMHHPQSFAECPPFSAPIAVAGHTHGGQIRLPLAPLMRYITYAKETEVAVSGWIRDGRIDGFGERGNNLYVSRGLGTSVVPLRLFCPPEITFFTLRRG